MQEIRDVSNLHALQDLIEHTAQRQFVYTHMAHRQRVSQGRSEILLAIRALIDRDIISTRARMDG